MASSPALQNAADARGVHGERFLHEDVAALGHGVFEVDGPESRRRGQQHDAARPHRVDGLLVGVQANELPLLGHVDLLGELAGQGPQAGLQAGIEEVGHRPELRGALGAQGLGGCPGAASAAAHQGNLDRVLFAGIGPRGKRAGQRRAGHDAAGLLKNLRREEVLLLRSRVFMKGSDSGGPCLGRGHRNPTTAARRSSVSLPVLALSNAMPARNHKLHPARYGGSTNPFTCSLFVTRIFGRVPFERAPVRRARVPSRAISPMKRSPRAASPGRDQAPPGGAASCPRRTNAWLAEADSCGPDTPR